MTLEALQDYFQETAASADPLFSWKKKAWDRLQEVGLPKRKQESFQYFPLQTFAFPPPVMGPSQISTLSKGPSLVFSNGFFIHQASRCPAPLVALPLDQAMSVYALFLQNRLMRTLKEENDPFALMNGAFQGRALFLYVPPNTTWDEPISIEHILDSSGVASPRLHIYVGHGAKITLSQRVEGEGCFNGVCDVLLDEEASLSFFDLASSKRSSSSWRLQAMRASLKQKSFFRYFTFSAEEKLLRTSLKVELLEEESETEIQGLYRLDGERQHHVHTLVEHRAPHTRSRQHFKSLLDDKSVFNFEGKIFVRPIAQKTEAYQLSNALLLSEEARVYAKPNLEILADDVKASHGATVGQLDQEAYFYLLARGLSPQEAKHLLQEGFCRELLDTVPPAILGG